MLTYPPRPPGKPHPRWAETGFRDGDPNEKWHSRATKCAPISAKRPAPPNGQDDPRGGGGGGGGRGMHPLLSPIKTEPMTEANAHLYRFSPSPAPSMRFHHSFQADVRSDSASSFEDPQRAPGYSNGANGGSQGGGMPYSGAPANGANGYNNGAPGAAPSTYSDGGGNGYPLSGSDDGHAYGDHYSGSGGSPPMHYTNCACRSAPALGVAYLNLSQTLQSAIGALRQFGPHHAPGAPCTVFRRIVDLSNALQYVPPSALRARASLTFLCVLCSSGTDSPGLVGPAYDSGPPSDNEIMTPLSASSGHTSFHTGSPGVSPQEWGHMAAAGFNPYFPAHDHHYSVNHVMS